MRSKILTNALIVFPLAGFIALTSCGGGKPGSSSGPAATPATPVPSPKSGLEADLEWVRKGQYTYVWVFTRKDGKPLDADDGNFLRANAPQVVDWVTTDKDKRYIVAGTNFDLAQGNLELLKKRFVAEDYTNK